jgi:hypothetical protein
MTTSISITGRFCPHSFKPLFCQERGGCQNCAAANITGEGKAMTTTTGSVGYEGMSLEHLKLIKSNLYWQAVDDRVITKCTEVCVAIGREYRHTTGTGSTHVYADGDLLMIYTETASGLFEGAGTYADLTVTLRGKEVISTRHKLAVVGTWFESVEKAYNLIKLNLQDKDPAIHDERQALIEALTLPEDY